ncbi:uronyl 2-sulfotransferase [Pocillopora verrucosa]|uniref:uronyl 2-sulfotransferase n=1 Tax=Pocillopora verrucosa TaxID=203993 RepID=UPI00334153BE
MSPTKIKLIIYLDRVIDRTTMQARRRFKAPQILVVIMTSILATCTISLYLTSNDRFKTTLFKGLTDMEKRSNFNIHPWEVFSTLKSMRKGKIIVYNRVGKCGSRTMIHLMATLTKKLGYKVIGSTQNSNGEVTLREQVELVDLIDQFQPPFIYHHHIRFVDFKRFGAVQPIYINLIRDPLARMVSSYYYSRFGDHREGERNWSFKGTEEQKNMTFDECVKKEMDDCVKPQRVFYIIPYFCGNEAFCRKPTSQALEQAKKNVMENYLVVGVTEQLEDFLFVLEKLLPEFFTGVLDTYKTPDDNLNSRMTSTRTANKRGPSPEVQEIMKKRMELEYEFYDFVKERFNRLKAGLMSGKNC